MKLLLPSLMLCVVVLVLTACPKKQDAAADAPSTSMKVNTIPPPSQKAPADDAATADASAPADSQTTASADTPAEEPSTPSAQQLAGRWFALYGRTLKSSRTYTYDDGHELQFLPNGSAIWIERQGGQDEAQFPTTWALENGVLSVKVTGSEPKGDLATASPLAFGRDSEIGLTNAGRDSEIGIESQKGEVVKAVFQFTPELDGEFLALRGTQGEIIIYGRVENPHAGDKPTIDGTWRGTVAKGQQSDAQFTTSGKNITATYGPHNSTFKGVFTHGYIVGQVSSTAGGETGFAALFPADSSRLSGVLTPAPIQDMQATYDFVKQP